MSPLKNSSDEDLMILYQQGDYEAFSELYGRHSRRVYDYLLRKTDTATASDLLQETFLKVHRSRMQYSEQYPFLPWLFTISRTVFLDHCKRAESKISNRASSALSPDELPDLAPAPLATTPDLSLALHRLPENQRRSIELRYLSEWSFEQIATELKTSPTNVRQLISRGIRKLQGLFKAGGK